MVRDSVSYFIIFAMSRQDLAQSRQDLAQAAICLSSAIFSQAAAQSSQHLAQHSAAVAERSLCRAHNVAHILQHSAQSTQRCMHLACSFFPSPTSDAQWWKHESQVTWQSAQTPAHFRIMAACGFSAANADALTTKRATATAP